MVSYRGDHLGKLGGVHLKVIKYTECHYRSALGVIHPVYKVTDIVKEACDPRKVYLPLRIAESRKNIGGAVRDLHNVCKAVLGIAKLP